VRIVVDASVIIKWFVPEPLHEEALTLLDHDDDLCAPDLLVTEVANIVWKKVLKGELRTHQGRRILDSVTRAPIEFFPAGLIINRALEIAMDIKHPVYDALYLALGAELGCTLISDDRKLCRIASEKGFDVRLLGAS